MKIIFMYPLYNGVNHIGVPVDFRILAIHEQHGKPHVWIEHEEPGIDTQFFPLTIVARPTGHRWHPEHTGHYIDSAFDIHGGLVFHFYQL